ncbi:STAS domain-containing protein [Adhaeribacter rhizoryzae]|uniref:STAS domain-containing protein n=1 Tax=Adhaeribacter rhizoryzae TaxID=2607907 RepID=A0A5M6DPX1_9BACT|nr:STAS domain-containing protein [Adhaeribacter rhizoryzae]KAA5548292.1 STAS domain-containing protein [Adhaeribacter rhizoryzae]
MKVAVHEDLQSFVIKPFGNFEDGDCQMLQAVLEQGAKSLRQHIFIDLKDLHNITTSGQRMLLAYSGQLAALHRLLVLFSVNQQIMQAFEASGLAKVINIAASLQEAKTLTLTRK